MGKEAVLDCPTTVAIGGTMGWSELGGLKVKWSRLQGTITRDSVLTQVLAGLEGAKS